MSYDVYQYDEDSGSCMLLGLHFYPLSHLVAKSSEQKLTLVLISISFLIMICVAIVILFYTSHFTLGGDYDRLPNYGVICVC